MFSLMKISRPVRLTGGDSASALRALRNGAPRTGAKGEKDFFPPLSSAGEHHSAANVVSERNLQQKAMSFT